MRVALVGPYPRDTSRLAGGVEASFVNLVNGLASTPGIEPHVVTFADHRVGRGYVEEGHVAVSYLPATRRFGNLTLRASERRALSETLSEIRPDVVHAQDALRHGYVSLRAKQPAPVVVSVHGIVREEVKFARSRFDRARIAIAGVSMERYCVRRAEYLVAPTRYAEQYFGSEIRGRIWDIGNPISEQFFEIEPAPEVGRILFTGALIPRKRVLDLVEAMPTLLEAVPPATLRLTGGASNPAYEEVVRGRVSALGLDDHVVFVGALGFDQLIDEYRRASVLALASGEETSPMVIGEAMAAGVPVVATRVGGVAHLVDDGVTGSLVEVGDVPVLGASLARFLAAPAEASAFGKAGRAKAERSYRIASVAGRVADVYAQICDLERTPRASGRVG